MKRFLSVLSVLSVLCSTQVFAAKTVFTDGNPATRTPGTKVTAAFLNAVNNHRHDGLNQDGSGVLDYAAATGSANHLSATLPAPLAAPVAGMPVQIRAAFRNTSGVTLNLSNTGINPVQKLGGLPLAAGDIQSGQILQFAFDGTNYQLLSYNSPAITDAATLNGQTAAMLSPPGMVGDFAMASVPPGWLLCDGRAVLRSQYPALYSAIGTIWGAGDNITTFNLPDFRGEFRRGWDNGRGIDVGRAIGTAQPDQLQNITGRIETITGGIGLTTGAFGTIASTMNHITAGVITAVDPAIIFDASRVARTGAETRPRNIAVLTCIKY